MALHLVDHLWYNEADKNIENINSRIQSEVHMKIDPKVYFAIDNCFASKRWAQPDEWAKVISELGIGYVEASADTECDPLYMGEDYTKSWTQQVKIACEKYNIEIANLYSGHGTYSTLGLAHWDERVRDRFRDQWMKKQMDTAKSLHAGMGFFAHAFGNYVLQDRQTYEDTLKELCVNLANIAKHAKEIGMDYVGVEQMYSPHQVPWTVQGATQMIENIYAMGNNPFYITIDTGHMSGQKRYLKPTKQYLAEAIRDTQNGAGKRDLWIGTETARAMFYAAVEGSVDASTAITAILKDCEDAPYLFAKEEDGSTYHWLEQLACYSPIIHLQQTDGNSSPHWPFDDAHNAKGIIDGRRVMQSIAKCYEMGQASNMPPMCDKLVLTLEPFIGTAGNPYSALEDISASVDYWRKVLPRDGMHLSEIMTHLSETAE